MPTLLPEQKNGVKWILKNLQQHKGVILADKMGLGKTAQAIEVGKYALKKHKDPVLIVVPAYLLFNWIDELEMWEFNQSLCIIDSTKQILHEADIYLCSYNMTVSEGIFKQLFKKSFSLIICDEGHYLKSWGSLRSKRILGTFRTTKTTLTARTKKFLLLTGTPILNNIEELYNLVIRLAPHTLNYMSRMDFILKFAAKIEHTPWGMKHYGVKNEKELKELVSSCLLQRTKITGLPARIDKNITINVKGAELKKLIKEELKFLSDHDIDPYKVQKDLKLSSMDMSEIAAVRQRTATFKIKFFMEVLQDILEKTKNIVIYVYHREVQKLLSERLSSKKLSHRIINGSVSHKKRAEIITEFQKGACNIILATISSLKEGVNLTNGEAVLYLEHDWTPANIEQGIGRVHRRGQKNTVYVYNFLFNDGIDLYIKKVLKSKQNVINKIMG